MFCKDCYKTNKIHELSTAKFTFSDFFYFPASKYFIKVLKERNDARLSIGPAANKFSLVF
jgi:hypothetical protein